MRAFVTSHILDVMKHSAPLVLIVLLMAACSDQKVVKYQESGSVWDPTLTQLVTMSSLPRCPKLSGGHSPAQFEEPLFTDRNVDGLVINGLNSRCITQRFGEADLISWSEKSDPVASYVLAVGYDQPFGSLCDRFDEVDELLTRAYEDGKSDKGVNATSRVPEAFIARGMLRKRCGRLGADAFYVDSRAAGLDAVEFFGGAW